MNTIEWLENKFCGWDGYVIMATFLNGSKRTQMWWPMNDDGTGRGRNVGSPCWSRKDAIARYKSEVCNPNNRGLDLALHKFSFNTCRHTMDERPTEVVRERRPCRYQ